MPERTPPPDLPKDHAARSAWERDDVAERRPAEAPISTAAFDFPALRDLLPTRLDPDAWVVDLNTGGGEFVQVAIRRGARRILGFERRRGLLESAQRRLSPYRLRGWVRLHEPRSTAAPDSRNRGRLALDEILLGLRNPARQWPVQLLKADAGDGNWTALAAAQRLDLVERVCGEFQLHPDERESGGEVHELARSLARFGFMVRWEVSPQANRDGLHLGLYCAERT